MNCTSWKQKSTTSPLSSQTLKDPEKPILPQFVIFKLSYLVGPSWGEIIGLSWTHTSCGSESKHKFWPEKCLLDYLLGETWREIEADLVHYFILKRLQAVVVVPDASHGTMEPVNDALIQRQSIISCFFLVQSTQVWWAGRAAFIKGGENNTPSVTGRKMFSFRGMRRLFAFMLWIRQH